MDTRANSPMQPASELYDHRNQPETLPIRATVYSAEPHSSPSATSANGYFRRVSSDDEPVRGRVDSLAVDIDSTAYEADAEEDVETADRPTTPLPPPTASSLQAAAAIAVRPSGGSIAINMPPIVTVTDTANPFSSSPNHPHSTARRNSIVSGGRGRRSRRTSNEITPSRRPTFTDMQTGGVPSTDAVARDATREAAATGMAANAAAAANNEKAAESDSDSSARSRVNSEDETEEDVCFPMHLQHQRINGIDFDEIEEFAAAQQEEWTTLPLRTRRADNDLGGVGRRLTFSTNSGARPLQSLGAAADIHNKAAITPKVTVAPSGESGVSGTSTEDEKAELLRAAAQHADMDDRFSLFCSESEETIHAPEICFLTGKGQSFAELFDTENGTWWLDCLNPTDAEVKMLAKAFGIHPLTAEDVREKETREKVELFRSYYFVCFRTFEQDKTSEDFLEPVNMYMVVFRDGILSFHFSEVDHTANVRRRIRQLRDYVNVSADWICYALIDDITDSFAPILREVEKEAEGIEDSVFVAREADFGYMLKRIGEARKTIMTLMRLLSGKADVIKMFAKRCNEQWDVAPKGEIGLYLGDIQDHIVTMYQNLSAYEKILSRSHANYLAQLQVESFHANNRVTSMLSKVTLLGTVLVPLNLITGLFGMNVKVPGEGTESLQWFFGIVGVIAFIVIVSLFFGSRWLRTINSGNEERLLEHQ
ncbi:uncharacterized protein V1518DRAFT_438330 [Limtongia smithiae]|uniref:uncharacterized protein n=1 Tax=Limtongia smithiae TaxID=1125753 RepID=UPI0034CFE42C